MSDDDRKRTLNQELGETVRIFGKLWIITLCLSAVMAFFVDGCSG